MVTPVWLFRMFLLALVVAEVLLFVDSAADGRTLIILGAFTLIGTLFASYMAYLSSRNAKSARKEAAEANGAVNHRHPDQPRLFDVVHTLRSQVDSLDRRFDRYMDAAADKHVEVMNYIRELDRRLNPPAQWDGVERRGRRRD